MSENEFGMNLRLRNMNGEFMDLSNSPIEFVEDIKKQCMENLLENPQLRDHHILNPRMEGNIFTVDLVPVEEGDLRLPLAPMSSLLALRKRIFESGELSATYFGERFSEEYEEYINSPYIPETILSTKALRLKLLCEVVSGKNPLQNTVGIPVDKKKPKATRLGALIKGIRKNDSK